LAKSQWSFKTAVELSAALAARKVSAVELAEDAIGRIERHDAKINAICVRDFERGLAAARAADAELARGVKKPLLGLPVTIKESYNIAGLPTTWGIPAQKDFTPPEDALPVSRSRTPAASSSARPTCRSGSATGRAITRFTHHQQPLRSRPHAGWLLRRIVGGASGGLRTAVARLRYRRLLARARVSLRHLCAQADHCAGARRAATRRRRSHRCRSTTILP